MVLKFLFCLQICKGLADNKKAKILSKEDIKTKLLDSMTIDEIVEFDDLNKETKIISNPKKQQI